MHQKLTFWNFIDIIVGGAVRRPLILRVAARFASGQAEVRCPLRFFDFIFDSPLRQAIFALPYKKNFCYCKFQSNCFILKL